MFTIFIFYFREIDKHHFEADYLKKDELNQGRLVGWLWFILFNTCKNDVITDYLRSVVWLVLYSHVHS